MSTVFNALTGRPSGYGIADRDIAYCDPGELSEEHEIAVELRADALRRQRGEGPVELEVVNQARVHRWYPERFGRSCPAYRTTVEAVARFQALCSCVGARRQEPGGSVEVIAPHGLDDLLALQVRGNRVQAPREVYEKKARRWRTAWRELTIDACRAEGDAALGLSPGQAELPIRGPPRRRRSDGRRWDRASRLVEQSPSWRTADAAT